MNIHVDYSARQGLDITAISNLANSSTHRNVTNPPVREQGLVAQLRK